MARPAPSVPTLRLWGARTLACNCRDRRLPSRLQSAGGLRARARAYAMRLRRSDDRALIAGVGQAVPRTREAAVGVKSHARSCRRCQVARAKLPSVSSRTREAAVGVKSHARSCRQCQVARATLPSVSVQRLLLVPQTWQVQEGVGPVSLHRHEVEVAPKVARIAAADW